MNARAGERVARDIMSTMAIRFCWLLVLLSVCFVATVTTAAHAQSGLFGSENALSITFSPVSPNAGDTLRLGVQSSVIDIPQSTILWQINGRTVAQGKGVSSASVKVGALGTETRVSVSASSPDGTIASAQAIIVPTALDLLVDSDSYTPPFYRGRPRPSVGTNLHVQALPHFIRGGVSVPASALTYTWRRNNEVMGNISGRGKSTASIPILHLFGTDTISVEARSDDGVLSHISSFPLSASEPVLALYEDHPLYGILYNHALAASTFIPETEMTFAAVPFFVQAQSIYDPALSFAWHVNSAEVAPSRTNPNELTINAENSSGVALVELDLTHATNYYLDVKGAWNITFSPQRSAADQFHPSGQ